MNTSSLFMARKYSMILETILAMIPFSLPRPSLDQSAPVGCIVPIERGGCFEGQNYRRDGGSFRPASIAPLDVSRRQKERHQSLLDRKAGSASDSSGLILALGFAANWLVGKLADVITIWSANK